MEKVILTLTLGALSALFFFIIAELFGRSRHIGRWWTFFLLWGCFVLPGVIALLLSPSAKKQHFKGNMWLEVIGVIIVILGILGIAFAFIESTGRDLIFPNLPLAFLILGLYIYILAQGKVRNKKPKYYFDGINILQFLKPKETDLGQEYNSYYYVVTNEIQEGPYSLKELREKRIYEDQLVWRSGLENWLPAKDVPELKSVIVHHPPPLPNVES
jgi:hypothetical protein